jgi:hypothetical protein
VTRVHINQTSTAEERSSDSLLIKLNETFGIPQLNFYLRSKEGSEQIVKDLIQKSVFKDQVKNLTFEALSGQDNAKKSGKIQSDHSAVISGLK